MQWQETANGAWQTGTFEEAISKVYDGGQIVLLSDISLTQTVTISKSVTISSKNQNKITCQVDQHGYLLNITSGTVTLTNIVIDGGSETNITASRALIAVKNGTLILGQNVVLQNNNNTTENGAGGGVCLIGGSIRMLSGSQISDNQAEQGGGVAIVQDANFYMEGGEILRNTATTSASYGKGGGGVYQTAGSFYMSGGSIHDNLSNACGGGVYLSYGNPSFILSRGTITLNQAVYGGGIYVESVQTNEFEHVLELSGGSIVENKATKRGGGILLSPQRSIVISGDIVIADNQNTNSREPGQNLYIDGWEDDDGLHYSKIIVGELGKNAQINYYSWLKPEPGQYIPYIIPQDNYALQYTDWLKISYEDPDYVWSFVDNTISLFPVGEAPTVIPPESEDEDESETYLPSTPISDGFHTYSIGTMYYQDGKRVRGWTDIDGARYYFDERGIMATGWKEIEPGSGDWYHFGEDGTLDYGWYQEGNVWYYLDPVTGLMYNDGLAAIDKSTYYFYDWGGMASDWWYEAEDGWYFFGGSGAMKAAQWLEWKGDWYYLTEAGKMAADTYIGEYYVDADGVWVK